MARSVQLVVATRWYIADVLAITLRWVPLTNWHHCDEGDALLELARHQAANPIARLLYQVRPALTYCRK